MHFTRLAYVVAVAAWCGAGASAGSPPPAIVHWDSALTATLIARGEYKSAETELRRVVEELEGLPDTRLVSARANLGVALFHQGRYSEAEVAYAAAAYLGDKLGVEPSEAAVIRNNMAALCRRTGRLDDAERWASESLALREAEGRDSPAVASALLTLAAIEVDRGADPQAEAQYRRAIGILTAEGESYEPQLASALTQLAGERIRHGDWDAAESLLGRATELAHRHWADDDARCATIYATFGALRLGQRKYSEARKEVERALALWRMAGRLDQAETAGAMNNLAQAYKLDHQPRKADPLYRQAMATCERWFSAGHPTCASIADNYADLQRRKGDALHEQAVEQRRWSVSVQELRHFSR